MRYKNGHEIVKFDSIKLKYIRKEPDTIVLFFKRKDCVIFDGSFLRCTNPC